MLEKEKIDAEEIKALMGIFDKEKRDVQQSRETVTE